MRKPRPPRRTQKLSRDGLVAIAEAVVRFARLPLTVSFRGPEQQPCINMRTNEMLLPHTMTSSTHQEVQFTVGHEVGHPIAWPRNAHWSTFCEMAASKQGYSDPARFANVVADLWANDWNLTRTPWSVTFAAEAGSFYAEDAHAEAQDPLWGFLARMMRARLEHRERGDHGLEEEVERAAFGLLFQDLRSYQERFKDLAALLRDRLAKAPALGDPRHLIVASSSLAPMDPKEDADELEEWSTAVAGLGRQAAFDHVKKHGGAGRVLFDVAELIAFSELMVAEDKLPSKAVTNTGPRSKVVWKENDNPLHLDLASTIRRYGIVVPGVTTLQKVDGPTRTESDSGRGTLFLVFDTSGSMCDCLGAMLIVGWAAALAAKRRRDRVAAMEFDSEPRYLLPPCEDYGRLKAIMEGLQAGGGTYLAPALADIVRVSQATRRKPTVVILTDGYIYDGAGPVLESLGQIRALGGRAIVCLEDARRLPLWVTTASAAGNLSAFGLGSLESIRAAIRRAR